LLVEDQRIVVRFAVGVRALVVDRERLASADTTRCTLPTTLPPLLSVKSLVWASIALPLPLSASGLPVIGWSLPSYARVTCIDISLPSAPTIF